MRESVLSEIRDMQKAYSKLLAEKENVNEQIIALRRELSAKLKALTIEEKEALNGSNS